MKYNDLVLENLKKISLKRIRIKVDPAQVSAEADFSKVDGYEGYVLEEGKGHLKILVINPELGIEDIPIEFIEAIADQAAMDTFEELKAHIIKCLIADGKVENDPVFQQIASCECLNNIEQIISQHGYTGDKLTELYKGFINEEA